MHKKGLIRRFSTQAMQSDYHSFALHKGTGGVLDFGMLLTCEHASMVLPPGWEWPEQDKRLLGMHWSFDLGSDDLTNDLRERFNCSSIASRFSRLLIDPNRPRDSPTLFRDVADGIPIQMNQGLSSEEKEKRIKLCYEPFHQALSELNKEEDPDLILSIHSFTPCYEGQKRSVEIGVLFQDDEQLAHKFNNIFLENNYVSRLNEPWSGKEGFMYSADQHSKWNFEELYSNANKNEKEKRKRTKKASAIMLEMRQDLIVEPSWRKNVVDVIEQLLRRKDTIDLIKEKK